MNQITVSVEEKKKKTNNHLVYSLSWCGFAELTEGDCKSALMKATSFGFFHVIWFLLNCWFGWNILAYSPKLRNSLYDFTYMLAILLLTTIFENKYVTSVMMGVGYYITGRSILPFGDYKLAILMNIILVFTLCDTDYGKVLVVYGALHTIAARPRIYDLNPCSLFFAFLWASIWVTFVSCLVSVVFDYSLLPFFFVHPQPVDFDKSMVNFVVNMSSTLTFIFFISSSEFFSQK